MRVLVVEDEASLSERLSAAGYAVDCAADVRADEAARGSGLGLAIVRDLAEIYGGSIFLEASPWAA